MTSEIRLFLLVLAAVFFLLAGLAVPEPPRIKWLGWGLFLYVAATVFPVR